MAGPLSTVKIADEANALVEGWYLGQEGGTAMADVLFGDVNPGGKLPVTIPRSVGQLPMFYNHKPRAHRGYLFDSDQAAVPVRLRAQLHDVRDVARRASRSRRSAPAASVRCRST